MTPEGIVVHNTAGTASAREEAAAMIASTAATSFHVVIDEAEAVECIPFARNAWHAGDGAAGYANRHLIGLEIARSMDTASTRFDQAEANAALYIAHICRQYGWTSAQLHQHNWYSSTACPHRTKTHWQTFLAQVDECIAALESGGGASEGAGSTAGAGSEGAGDGGAQHDGGESTAGANNEGTGAGGAGDAGTQNDGRGSTAGANSGGAGSAAGTNAGTPTITILCDGQLLTLRGRNENGTIYTSLRDLATALGHTVRWENGMAAAILRLPNGVGCAMLKTNTIGSERKGSTSMKMIR